ncbi:unnamed protein product [Schistosoma mattheei]|uniref:Ig-like domain-containing protein n=1 Tax=Schistosoma mattheei TaxID=31246 RepID=A0AA85B1D1_9TREM|nr:unnamed protein product [Schistosoma mattheei]
MYVPNASKGVETTSTQNLDASDTNLFVAPYPTSLERIRLRLRKRIWKNISSLLIALPLLYDDGHLKAEVTTEANLKARNLSSLYFTVSKPSQPTSVIKTSTTNTHLSETTFRIKNAKSEHTGIYRCIFKGEVIRAWSVTVLKPGDEPFRNLFSQLKIIQEKPELISGNTSNGDDDLKSLVTQHLINNNLKLYTYWNSCNITTLFKSPFNKLSRLPKRIAIQVNEGEPLIITCPIRNSVEKPITWFYAPDNFDELIKLIKTAYNFTTIIQHKTPLRYLVTTLKQVNFTTLIRETRGRYRIDPAYNIIVAETVSLNKTKHKELHNLICIHGDAYSIPNGSDIYPDWSGIIYIDVLPQSSLARILSKLTPVIQIMMPFVLALGIFFMIMLTLYTERRPQMRLAAKGLVVK